MLRKLLAFYAVSAATANDLEPVVENLCQLARGGSLQHAAVGEMICKTALPSIPKAACRMMVVPVLDIAGRACPEPEDAKKACSVVGKSSKARDMAAKGLCAVANHLHIPKLDSQQDCEPASNKIWHAACPSEVVEEETPTPEDIEKIIMEALCSVVKDKVLEKSTVEEVCEMLHQAVPEVPETMCTQLMERALDKFADKCPKAHTIQESVHESRSDPCNIFQDRPDIEKAVGEDVCRVVKKFIPADIGPLCMSQFHSIWNKVGKECSVAEEKFCEAVKDQELMNMTLAAVCNAVEGHIPGQDDPCMIMAARLLEKARENACPNGQLSLLEAPSPKDIEDMICKFMKEVDTEKMGPVFEGICAGIHQSFPAIPVEMCSQALIEGVKWVQERCPKQFVEQETAVVV